MDTELEKKLSELATKKELKAEVAKLATKEELKSTKEELKKTNKSLDRVAFQVIENSEKIEKLVTKDEFNEKMGQVMNTLDKVMVIVQRIDQERMFTTEWIRRIDTDVEVLKKR